MMLQHGFAELFEGKWPIWNLETQRRAHPRVWNSARSGARFNW
jgi:hypothetical protein